MYKFYSWLLIREEWGYYDNWYSQFRKEKRELRGLNQEFMDRQNFVAYHRTTSPIIANNIMKKGFYLTPVGERVYGNGVYFSLSLDDWRDPSSAKAYGDWLIAASIPGRRMVDAYEGSWQKQLEELGVNIEAAGIERGTYNLGTGNQEIFEKIKRTGKVDGISFRGKSKVGGWLVLFNANIAKPIKIAYYPEQNTGKPIQWMKEIPQQYLD